MKKRNWSTLLGLSILTLASACNGTDPTGTSIASAVEKNILPDSSVTDPVNPPVQSAPTPSPTASAPSYTTQVLLFNGTGVSTSDWQSTESILQSQGLTYDLVNTVQMNSMTVDQIAQYGIIVVPGGSGGTIAGSLSNQAQINIRQAIRDRGVGYVGFCAGAWVAVGPEANTNSVAGYGLAVAKGAVLPSFDVAGDPTAAIVPVTFSDGSVRDLVWWGGPSTPEWTGGVVARYSNGVPAISETLSGKGYVVISGPHPEAPQGWRATAGNDPDGLDYSIAIKMFQAALTKTPMSHF